MLLKSTATCSSCLVFLFLLGVALISANPRIESRNDNPVINTNYGQLMGESLSCGILCSYFSFKGIPYAAPPLGNLRFRAPIEPESWTGVREALNHGPSCPAATPSLLMGEDCLYLNVYTRSFTGNQPVLVWLHGGGFMSGSGDSLVYGPEHLIEEDVIIVSLNYRVGALGFLSTGDANASGNYGLKDMILALKWIRENIANFGGDPNNVTIFGQSAGGAAVHYLILSPMARGYFQKAISMSGSALNHLFYQPDPAGIARELAANLGLSPGLSSAQLIAALREMTPDQLIAATSPIVETENARGLTPPVFVPCTDPPGTTGNEIFLPRHPMEIMESGGFNHVPLIIGYTSAESLFYIRETILNRLIFDNINADPELLVPFWWNIPRGSAASIAIAEAIRNFYWNGVELTSAVREQWTRYLTDSMFIHGIDRTARMHAERQSQSVFYYQFSFVGSLNLMRNMLLIPSDYEGAVHADDLFHMFSVTSVPPPLFPTNEAITTRRRMVRMWGNFAKTGNPTSSFDLVIGSTNWQPVFGTQEFLDIDTDLTTGRWPNQERVNFWDNLEATYL